MRSLMKMVIDTYVPQVQETLPEALRRAHHLASLAEALRQVHFPDDHADLLRFNSQQTPFHERLVFEEFFLLELGLALRHRAVQREPGPCLIRSRTILVRHSYSISPSVSPRHSIGCSLKLLMTCNAPSL